LRVRLKAEEPNVIYFASLKILIQLRDNCNACGAIDDITIIKYPKSQIFVDVSQDRVNHGSLCVM
jgi:hypothetical protein